MARAAAVAAAPLLAARVTKGARSRRLQMCQRQGELNRPARRRRSVAVASQVHLALLTKTGRERIIHLIRKPRLAVAHPVTRTRKRRSLPSQRLQGRRSVADHQGNQLPRRSATSQAPHLQVVAPPHQVLIATVAHQVPQARALAARRRGGCSRLSRRTCLASARSGTPWTTTSPL